MTLADSVITGTEIGLTVNLSVCSDFTILTLGVSLVLDASCSSSNTKLILGTLQHS
jgi:hypothetical protein